MTISVVIAIAASEGVYNTRTLATQNERVFLGYRLVFYVIPEDLDDVAAPSISYPILQKVTQEVVLVGKV